MNDVQVFGLPRSGTNFIEWSLKNNFIDVKYSNLYEEKKNIDIKMLQKFKDMAVKHQYPSFKYSNKIIVIYKEWDKWIESYRRWEYGGHFPKKEYDKYLEISRNLDPAKTIILEHTWAFLNYKEAMLSISNKFGFKPKEEIVQPTGYMNKGGANAEELPQGYVHI